MNIIVGSVVVQDGKILLVQEARPAVYGQWNVPAGYLDEGETIVSGAIRETKEETGYDVEPEEGGLLLISDPTFQVRGHAIVVILFKMKVVGGELAFDKNEILDAKWVPIDETSSLEFRDGIRRLLGEILRRLKSGESYPLSLTYDAITQKEAG
ncbi:NUDIX hydrolase [Candidatus Saccharibacteria bacterium]|nr:NUDIX hydrolase [Candidatus Saccharibacteria bacterium]